MVSVCTFICCRQPIIICTHMFSMQALAGLAWLTAVMQTRSAAVSSACLGTSSFSACRSMDRISAEGPHSADSTARGSSWQRASAICAWTGPLSCHMPPWRVLTAVLSVVQGESCDPRGRESTCQLTWLDCTDSSTDCLAPTCYSPALWALHIPHHTAQERKLAPASMRQTWNKLAATPNLCR